MLVFKEVVDDLRPKGAMKQTGEGWGKKGGAARKGRTSRAGSGRPASGMKNAFELAHARNGESMNKKHVRDNVGQAKNNTH